MSIFVDTSALYALFDEGDANHRAALRTLRGLRGSDLTTHAYVIVESLALLGSRLPWGASERFLDAVSPLIDVRPVDDTLHRAAIVAYLGAGSAAVSFVDRTSFAFMRALDIRRAFAFDADFPRNGFELIGR